MFLELMCMGYTLMIVYKTLWARFTKWAFTESSPVDTQGAALWGQVVLGAGEIMKNRNNVFKGLSDAKSTVQRFVVLTNRILQFWEGTTAATVLPLSQQW